MAPAAAALSALFSPTTQPPPPLISKPSTFPSNNNNLSFSLLSFSGSSLFIRRHSQLTPHAAAATNSALVLLHDIGFSENQIHLLFQTHPPLQFSSPDSLHRRIEKLQSLNITGIDLLRVIDRRPEVLTAPEFDPFLDFVHREITGLYPEKLERVLVLIHPQRLHGFIKKVQFLEENGIPKEVVGYLLNNVSISKVFDEMPLQELERTVVFLGGFGWPEIVIRRPTILNLDLESQLIARVEFLIELADGDEAAAAFFIRKLPAILSYTVEHFKSHLEFWRSIGFSKERVFKIALVYPNVFSVSRDRKLKPRIEFLTQCGFNSEDIFKFLIKAPTFLSLSFRKNLSIKLGFLVKIGYKHRTRELAFTLGAATRTSCENMQMVIVLFLSFNFSCEDLLIMSKKHPQILQYNYNSLEKKMEFLIEEMERDIGELMAFPAFLGYKLDDRIKHRYEVKKEIRGKGMSLNKLLSVSTKRFNLKTDRASGD